MNQVWILSPKHISNYDMGTIFEELIRKFSESSNEKAGEHFTPRDVVEWLNYYLQGEEETSGSIKLVYDPACGTGGMLTSCKEFITKNNPEWMLYYMIKKQMMKYMQYVK